MFESIELNSVLVCDYRQRKVRDQGDHSSATINVEISGTRDIENQKQKQKQKIDSEVWLKPEC